MTLDAEELLRGVEAGSVRALARAASAIEAQTAMGRELIRGLFDRTGRARIVGVTGPPGAGKSTLADALAKRIRAQDETVGIVAVDPSSPITQGAILGDRVRMGDHFQDPGVFIRSMAARGRLGGLAQATLEMALLLDGAGWDFVLIETVGVGQHEIEVAKLADVTVVVLMPGMGDDVQAIKAGVMEIADVFAINKADLPGAERLEREIQAAQSLSTAGETVAPVQRVSAKSGDGVDELLKRVEAIWASKNLVEARRVRWRMRLEEMTQGRLRAALPAEVLDDHARRVADKSEDPYRAVDELVAAMMGTAGKRHDGD